MVLPFLLTVSYILYFCPKANLTINEAFIICSVAPIIILYCCTY